MKSIRRSRALPVRCNACTACLSVSSKFFMFTLDLRREVRFRDIVNVKRVLKPAAGDELTNGNEWRWPNFMGRRRR